MSHDVMHERAYRYIADRPGNVRQVENGDGRSRAGVIGLDVDIQKDRLADFVDLGYDALFVSQLRRLHATGRDRTVNSVPSGRSRASRTAEKAYLQVERLRQHDFEDLLNVDGM